MPTDPVLDTSAIELVPDDAAADQLEISFGRVEFSGLGRAHFSENVEIRSGDRRFSSEDAEYDRDAGRVAFEGRVAYSDSEVTVFAEDGEFNLNSGSAEFASAGFEIPSRPARGEASQLVIDDATQTVSMSVASFTTCPMEAMAWQLEASDVNLQLDDGFGTARAAKLRFGGVPIMYVPYFTFPINDERKSGFLTPDFSERDTTGLYISVPYYFNLAPNYDLVVDPRYLSKRGVQLANQFRYLLPRSDGSFDFEYLPRDSEADRTRSYLNLQHRSEFGANWELITGIEEVSDEAYFEDLGSSLSITSQTHLNRFVDLNFYSTNWSLLTRFQNYQTIDALIVDSDRPYERVPQMLFEGAWDRRLLSFTSATELVNFDRDVGTTGWRLDSTQEFSLRFARRGMYLTPALAWRQTNYWLDDFAPDEDDTPARGLPVGSVDTGIVLERSSRGRRGLLQTLEPRMLYVSVPFEEQGNLPVFDTIVPDFNLVQLFRKYRFIGPDRISDTDQLSVGVTTRLIDPGSGRQQIAATLGQTRYLTPRQVGLPGEPEATESESDYVAELAISLSRMWNLEVGYQWNSETDSTARAESWFEYRPDDNRLLGFGYRFRRNLVEQADMSIVWPLAEKWRLIGRLSYSLLEDEPLEEFIGWEYEACCWRLRMVGRQYVSRQNGEKDKSISLQLELKGFSQRASSPEELLDRGILGYRRTLGGDVQ